MRKVRSQNSQVTSHKSQVRCLVMVFLLFTVLVGCGISKDIYQKTVEESEARKAGLEQAQKELARLQDENQQLKSKVAELSKQIEELSSAKAGLEQAQKDLARLQEEKEQLKNKIDELSRQIEELSAAKDVVSQTQQKLSEKTEEEPEGIDGDMEQAQKEIARLQEENQQLKSKIGELSRQIEELAAAKEGEINALKSERDGLLSKVEYLNGEVERLKIKADEIAAEKERELESIKSAYENLKREMEKEMKKEMDNGEVKVTHVLDRISVIMVEKILFDSGKAEIKPEGLNILERVGNILKGITDKQIKVEGHTDNVIIGQRIKDRYPTNWELSTARATKVVRYLQYKAGIDPKLLSAAGYSEYKPVADNDTAEGRAQNRRMEIVLLPLDFGSVVEEFKKE